MEHSRKSYVFLTRLCLYVLSIRDTTWKICSFKRPCKAQLKADDYFLHSGCVTINGRDVLTITSETQNPFLMLQNFDVWTTLCRIIKRFNTCFVVTFVHEKRIKKRLCGDENAKERWKIPSEDASKEVLAQILKRDCLEMQNLALFLLGRFSYF